MIVARKSKVFSVVMQMMLLLSSLSSQKGSVRLLARAFTQNPTTRGVLPVAGSKLSYSSTASLQLGKRHQRQQQRFRSSAQLEASVEEDLDLALSSILEDAKKAPKVPQKVKLAAVPPKREQAARLEPVSLSDLLEEVRSLCVCLLVGDGDGLHLSVLFLFVVALLT